MAAGGKGPPGLAPSGAVNSGNTDRRAESAFYRNATYTSGTTNSSAPLPFILQEVPLIPFDGDIREYPRFRDHFLDIMEAQPNLEPRYKLVHLLQYLRGEPLRMADRLHLTDENYFIVADRLEKRYGSKVALHSVLFRDFTHLPPLTSTMLSDVTRFYDDAFQLTTALAPLIKKDDTIAHAVLIGKILPKKLRQHLIEESCYANDQTVDGLLNALDHLVWTGRLLLNNQDLFGEQKTDVDVIPRPILWDDDEGSEHTPREDKPEGSDKDRSEPASHQATAAPEASKEPRLKERRTCPLCRNGSLHTAFRCDVFTNVSARLRRIQKLKLCLLCLREGHQAATCPRKTTDSCKICNKGPHNRAVCMTANDRTRASSRRRSQVRATGSSVGPKHPDQDRRAQKPSVNSADAKRVSTAIVRPSEAQSSSKSTPKTNRKKRSKKPGAAPSRRNGTSRPPTNSTAESMKQKTAVACGDSSLLPASQGLQPTDRCSKTNESTQFNQRAAPDGSKPAIQWESTDAEKQHELREAEEDSSSESSGSYTDSQTSSTEDPPDSNPLQPQVTEPRPSGHPHDEELQPVLWQPYTRSDDDISMPSSSGHNSNIDYDWD